MEKIVLAVDLGGTNLRIAAVTRSGKILNRVKKKTPRSTRPEDIVNAISVAVDECKVGLVNSEITAIGAAVPGIINFAGGSIFKSPNLPQLDGFNIVKALKTDLNIEAVLENDANAAAIGESWLGASRGFENSIMVTLGTGVGGGIIINGEVLRGVDGTAGEIGHINVLPVGEACGCGSSGCVEQYTSATAVVRMAKELAFGKSDAAFSNVNQITSRRVYELAKDGDKIAKEVFDQQGYYLGVMLAGLVNTLNPEVIVIGGGASDGWDLFYPSLISEIRGRAYDEPSKRVRVVRADLADDAGILGVARLAFGKAV